MKKLFRNIFSGYFFVLLLLLIEVLILLFAQTLLDDLATTIVGDEANDETVRLIISLIYLAGRFIIFIVALIIFFKIINKEEDPEFKIPWIVGMLLLPLFSSFMFLIFGNHGLRKKDERIVRKTNEAIRLYARNKYKMDVNAKGAFKYIHATTNLYFFEGNRVKYYSKGEDFFPEMMEELKKATKFIFIEFFIISEGKLWDETLEILKEKAQSGVEVRVIYDDMGCSGTIPSSTPRKLRKLGIKCYKFHPFRPILSGVYNNRDHRKIVVIDGKVGFTGGMNLADEYANIITRFGYWKDTMVKIEGNAVKNLSTVFLQNYDLCTYKVSNYEEYLNIEGDKFDEPGIVMPFGDGPGGIDDALIGEQTYINILNYAKREVYISTPYLIPTYELLDALRNAALRDVDVHLIVPGIPDKKLVYKIAQSNFSFLLKAGVKIHTYTPGFNHMKTILADNTVALVGTINFDFRSLVHHFECGALLYDCPCLKDIKEDFLEMISVSNEVPVDFKLSKSTRRLCSLVKLFTPLL